MKVIPLSRGLVTKVSNADYPVVSRWKWYAQGNGQGDYYAARDTRKDGGKLILLHQFLLGFPGQQVDHRNRNKLDNRRSNLRVATVSQNRMNVGLRRDNVSGYKGVFWVSERKRWRAIITYKGRSQYITQSTSKVAAALAYDAAAKRLFGKFAKLNFPNFHKQKHQTKRNS